MSNKKEFKFYVASLSGGKDSTAMVDRLIKEGRPLTHVISYDTGMEFKATYKVIESMRKKIEGYGAQLVVLKPDTDFLFDMLIRPIKTRGTENTYHYGYDWCGGCCRWRTKGKIETIGKFLSTLDGPILQYIGIAADEPARIRNDSAICYPLVEWAMTEKDCLEYCYEQGYNWKETPDTPDLYQLLDRVSCWCCGNKNLKELRNMYHYLPNYWAMLKGMQSRIDRPFYHDKTVFELEERFKIEDAQMSIFDFI